MTLVAQSIKWASDPTGNSAINANDPTLADTLLVSDNAAGDTSTGVVSGTNAKGLVVIYDFGSVVTVSRATAAYSFPTNNGHGAGFSYSTDGATWNGYNNSPVDPSKSGTNVTATVSARYIRCGIAATGTGAAQCTDFRVYDANGSAILPPGSTIPAPPRNLTIAIVY